jgi:hypothetical protein
MNYSCKTDKHRFCSVHSFRPQVPNGCVTSWLVKKITSGTIGHDQRQWRGGERGFQHGPDDQFLHLSGGGMHVGCYRLLIVHLFHSHHNILNSGRTLLDLHRSDYVFNLST